MSHAVATAPFDSPAALRLRAMLESLLAAFPWRIEVSDWTGRRYRLGLDKPHWRGLPLILDIESEAAGRELLALNPLGFLDRYVHGEADIGGNLYLLAAIRDHARLDLPLWKTMLEALANRALSFQSVDRARVNVKSHYDIPQEALDLYLDREYLSYSCGMFDEPERLDVDEMKRVGAGRADEYDSLEKAQWRKFQDAADFVAPAAGESVLDIGCGYGGQLRVLLESYPQASVVGWTHSHNQAVVGREKLAAFEPATWRLREGDYREESGVFDHITSTGMISHVGPRGLVPYVREIRKRIEKGGRYLHHSLMTPHWDKPFDAGLGVAFNKKYVWPGFHWFTLGDHVKALEQNGFTILRLTNLSPHYAKTTAAWYERMVAAAERFSRLAGEGTCRAWKVYLASASTGFRVGTSQVYRLYCRAV